MTTDKKINIPIVDKKMLKAFNENISVTEATDGRFTAKCKKGLFSVSCHDEVRFLLETMSYFSQYYSDGEYD